MVEANIIEFSENLPINYPTLASNLLPLPDMDEICLTPPILIKHCYIHMMPEHKEFLLIASRELVSTISSSIMWQYHRTYLNITLCLDSKTQSVNSSLLLGHIQRGRPGIADTNFKIRLGPGDLVLAHYVLLIPNWHDGYRERPVKLTRRGRPPTIGIQVPIPKTITWMRVLKGKISRSPPRKIFLTGTAFEQGSGQIGNWIAMIEDNVLDWRSPPKIAGGSKINDHRRALKHCTYNNVSEMD